jgi:uncharacterized protein involved in exopolysaccharide biosynthesis
MNAPAGTEQAGLREYALLLWGRKLLVIVVFLVAVGGCLGYCVISKAKYTATSELLLTPTLSPTLLEANGGLTQNQLVDVPSDSQIIESDAVQNLVANSIPGVSDASVTQIGTTDVVKVAVTEGNAHTAAQAADLYARDYIKFEQQQTANTLTTGIKLLEKHLATVQVGIASLNAKISAATTAGAASGLQSQLTSLNQENSALENELANYEFFSSNGNGTQSGQVISTAAVPTSPSSPKTITWTAIAGIAGIVIGVGLAMLVEALSDGSKRRV